MVSDESPRAVGGNQPLRRRPPQEDNNEEVERNIQRRAIKPAKKITASKPSNERFPLALLAHLLLLLLLFSLESALPAWKGKMMMDKRRTNPKDDICMTATRLSVLDPTRNEAVKVLVSFPFSWLFVSATSSGATTATAAARGIAATSSLSPKLAFVRGARQNPRHPLNNDHNIQDESLNHGQNQDYYDRRRRRRIGIVETVIPAAVVASIIQEEVDKERRVITHCNGHKEDNVESRFLWKIPRGGGSREDPAPSSSRPRRTLVLGVDGGTESLRVGCFDASTGALLVSSVTGKPITCAVPYSTKHPHPGWAEQESKDWYNALCRAVREVLQILRQEPPGDSDGAAGEVAALCLDTTCCSVVAMDHQFQPLRPSLLWMDQRSAPQTEQMATIAAEDPALFINGGSNTSTKKMISAEWYIPKSLWLHQNEYNSTWERARYMGEYQDYMNYRLTGKFVASACNAAVRWHWDARFAVDNDNGSQNATHSPFPGRPLSLYETMGIPDLAQKLPQSCLAMGQVIGPLTPQAALDLGFVSPSPSKISSSRTPLVVQGGPDAFVGMIGLGCIGHSTGGSSGTTTASTTPQLCLITGSSHLHCMVVPAAKASPSSTIDGGSGRTGMWGPYQDAPLPGLAFGEGGQSSTGSLLKWAHAKLFGTSHDYDEEDDNSHHTTPLIPTLTYKELDDWASEIPPGSGGLVAVETFQGSRTPVTDPLARGALVGLTLSHTKGHIWRALMEGVCFGTRACLEALEAASENGEPCEEIILAGGITKSPLWLQLHADITNRPIRVFGPDHNAPLLGCAILASLGLGIHDNVERAVEAMLPPSTVILPNPDNVALYDRIYRNVYAPLVSSIRPVVHAIHRHVLEPNFSAAVADSSASFSSPTIEKMDTMDKRFSKNDDSDYNENNKSSGSDDWSGRNEVVVSPSLLACDFAHVGTEIKRCLDAGATRFHVDVFDGVALRSPDAFTFGPAMVRSIAQTLQKNNEKNREPRGERPEEPSMDLHMCVHRPERFVEAMAEAANGTPCRFIFQWEGLPKWGRLNKALYLARCIQENNMQCGVSLSPNTPVEEIYPLLESGLISVVDILAVEPGFGGQNFQSHVLSKLATLQQWRTRSVDIEGQDESSFSLNYYDIMIDGGVNNKTARRIIDAGADILVSGSFLFGHKAGIRAAMDEIYNSN